MPSIIATITEERDLAGRLVAERGFDAEGEQCWSLERDPDTGRTTWINLRDDLAAERPDLAAARDELMAAH